MIGLSQLIPQQLQLSLENHWNEQSEILTCRKPMVIPLQKVAEIIYFLDWQATG